MLLASLPRLHILLKSQHAKSLIPQAYPIKRYFVQTSYKHRVSGCSNHGILRQLHAQAIVPLGRRYIHPRGPTKSLPVPEGKFHILFFGGDEFSCYTLRKLYEATDVWKTLEVVTQEDRQLMQHGKKFVQTPVKQLAEELGLNYHLMPNAKEDLKRLKFPPPFDQDHHPPNRLLIVSSIGRYIPASILNRFPPSRRLNVHPSLIPKYRGAAPIQWTIADGLEETGVSVIEVEKVSLGYDVGDIWAQKMVEVPRGEKGVTYGSLMPILAEEGSGLLVDVLRRMIDGTQPDSIEQDASQATLAPAIDASTALVDWWHWDADKIERRSRAVAHQKPIHTFVFDEKTTLQLFDVSVLSRSHSTSPTTQLSPGTATLNKRTGNLEVACANKTILAVGSVKQMNRKRIPAKEWWIGVQDRKKPGGVVSFHMGPLEDEEHPGRIEQDKEKGV